MMTTSEVKFDAYMKQYATARLKNPLIAENCATYSELESINKYDNVRWFGGRANAQGFGVTESGELIGLFSSVPGAGNDLIAHAISEGAIRLDCFDGYLTSLYERHGFVEVHRAANWNEGQPNVVYMELQDE